MLVANLATDNTTCGALSSPLRGVSDKHTLNGLSEVTLRLSRSTSLSNMSRGADLRGVRPEDQPDPARVVGAQARLRDGVAPHDVSRNQRREQPAGVHAALGPAVRRGDAAVTQRAAGEDMPHYHARAGA